MMQVSCIDAWALVKSNDRYKISVELMCEQSTEIFSALTWDTKAVKKALDIADDAERIQALYTLIYPEISAQVDTWTLDVFMDL